MTNTGFILTGFISIIFVGCMLIGTFYLYGCASKEVRKLLSNKIIKKLLGTLLIGSFLSEVFIINALYALI